MNRPSKCCWPECANSCAPPEPPRAGCTPPTPITAHRPLSTVHCPPSTVHRPPSTVPSFWSAPEADSAFLVLTRTAASALNFDSPREQQAARRHGDLHRHLYAASNDGVRTIVRFPSEFEDAVPPTHSAQCAPSVRAPPQTGAVAATPQDMRVARPLHHPTPTPPPATGRYRRAYTRFLCLPRRNTASVAP